MVATQPIVMVYTDTYCSVLVGCLDAAGWTLRRMEIESPYHSCLNGWAMVDFFKVVSLDLAVKWLPLRVFFFESEPCLQRVLNSYVILIDVNVLFK